MSINITSLPSASTIDPVNDVLPIVTNNINTTQKINLNTLLGTSSQTVSINDNQTLTNKILTAPTISSPVLSGTITGTYTIGGTPTFPASVVTLTGSQTLTNKVLTSPTINSPTITNATLSADTITGFTTSGSGTIYGLSVAAGAFTTSGIIGTTGLQANAVQANQLATNAITLGYAQITGDVTLTTPTVATQVTGLTVTVTIPSGGRKVKITVYSRYVFGTSSSVNGIYTIWDGTVGSGTQLQESQTVVTSTTSLSEFAIITPAAGSKTYNVGAKVSAGNLTIGASATAPAFILVEAI